MALSTPTRTVDELSHAFKTSLAITQTVFPGTEETDFNLEKELEAVFEKQAEEGVKELPVLPNKPAELLDTTELKPFQNEAVRWMVNMERNPKENPNSACIMHKDGVTKYYDLNDACTLPGPYRKAKGFILADGTGIGHVVLHCILNSKFSTSLFCLNSFE